MNEKILALSKPFEPEYISWLPGATNKNQADPKCMAMAYADLRAYMHRLDEVFGCEWSNTVTPWGDKLIVSVTINGVTRSSTGEPDADSIKSGNPGTVTEAQAFKRACAMWGLGRYLYEFKSEWVKFDPQSKKIDPTELRQLNKRYFDWYEKQVRAKSSPQPEQKKESPKAVMPAPQKSKDEEPKPWLEWKNGEDAKKAALENKWCINEFEARNSLLNSLEAVTGQKEQWYPAKQDEVFFNFYDKHMSRQAAQLQQAA